MSYAHSLIRSFVPQCTLPNIYNSLVQSHFDFCSPVWGNCGKRLFNKLQKLQNRAARVITSSNYELDADSLFHKLSWKDLKSQRQIQNVLMVFKSFYGLVPEYLTSKFLKRNESNYSLRDSVNKLLLTTWKIVLVMAAQSFGIAYLVTSESLVH